MAHVAAVVSPNMRERLRQCNQPLTCGGIGRGLKSSVWAAISGVLAAGLIFREAARSQADRDGDTIQVPIASARTLDPVALAKLHEHGASTAQAPDHCQYEAASSETNSTPVLA